MNSKTPTARQSRFKNPFLYSSIVILVVAIYVGFVMLSRYESKRDFEKRSAAAQVEKRLENDRLAVEQLGGSELSIRTLYVSPSIIGPGEPAQLCYDVANAKTITLDPPVAEVWPSHSRCIDLKARKTTTFTLAITDTAGRSVTRSVELKVR